MADNLNNDSKQCACVGSKKIKAFEKEIEQLKAEVLELSRQIATLRKAVRK
jgi:cell division protein FtsB